jgi:flagellin
MTVINTNVASLFANAAIASNSVNLNTAMQQLSTGKRINSASDDAAGMAIVNNFTAQINGLNQAVRNANDGISMLQTAQGATNEVSSILQRMRELAVQAANGTYSTSDRNSIEAEDLQLKDELGRISSVTKWNGINLLDGSLSASFQVGYGNSTADQVSIRISQAVTINPSGLNISATLSTASGAATMLGQVDNAITTLNTIQGKLGALVNRFQMTADELTANSTNLSQSQSRIQDTDYGQSTSNLARAQVINQAATAMLAQANQQPQLVLQLLK